MKSKRLFINMFASIISFAITMGISFFVSPYIVEKLGDEAYGFIGLANNFVSYASVLTIALNSMAGRFISIAVHKNDEEKAQRYYSSVFFANAIIAIVLAFVSIGIILKLNSLINVSDYIYKDVQITFSLVFINFIISIVTSIFSIATFVTNRLDLSSIRNIISNFIRVAIMIPLFILLPPKIYYIIIAVIIASIFLSVSNYLLSVKLLPQLKVRKRYFSLTAIKELLSSGVWNSINNLSTMLLTGLDLLIANLFISPAAMGVLSIAKIVPSSVLSLLGTIGGIFTPQFTILYAQDNIEGLVKEAKFSIKILSFMMTVPLAGFIVFGTDFFSLWFHSKTYSQIIEIQILSVLTIGPNLISSYIYSLYSINTVTNKLKTPVILTFCLSILSTIIVFILLKTTNLGIYAIAGVSSVILLLRVLLFVPIYAAHNLNVKYTTFYAPLIRAIFCVLLLMGIYIVIERFVHVGSWFDLAFVGGMAGVLGYVLSFMFILNKEEKGKVKSIFINKIKSKRRKEVCE